MTSLPVDASSPQSPPPASRLVTLLRRADAALARAEEAVLLVALLALVLVGVYGAVKRNFLPPSPFWIDEVVRYLVFFIGLVGAALATQARRLFHIDVLTRLLSPRGKLVARLASSLFAVVVCGMLYAASMVLRRQVAGEPHELVDPALGILPLPIAAVLIVAHLMLHAALDVHALATGHIPHELVDERPAEVELGR